MDVSVVITNYNKGPLVRDAVESALPQLQGNDEIIVVDDASTDGLSKTLIRKLISSNRRITFLEKNENSGCADSKNTGVRHARNELIALLDADDVLPPGALDAIRRAFQLHPEVDFVFGDYILRNIATDSSQLICCAAIVDEDQYLVPRLLLRNWLLLGSSPFRKRVFETTGGFDPMHPRTDDVDFQLRMVLSGAIGYYIGAAIYEWNRYPTGNNSNVSKLDSAFCQMRNLEVFYRQMTAPEFLKRVAGTSIELALSKVGILKW